MRAAAFKLFGNLTIIGITGILGDVNRLAHAVGISSADAFSLFEHFNPGATVSGRMKRMIDAAYDQPSWELAMARKDARIMQAEADTAGVGFVALPAIVARMDEMIARGHARHDWTVIAKDYLDGTGNGTNS